MNAEQLNESSAEIFDNGLAYARRHHRALTLFTAVALVIAFIGLARAWVHNDPNLFNAELFLLLPVVIAGLDNLARWGRKEHAAWPRWLNWALAANLILGYLALFGWETKKYLTGLHKS